jgi:hypothetical protein
MNKLFSLMSLALVLSVSSAMAKKHEGGPGGSGNHREIGRGQGIEKRVENQKKRIDHQVEKGNITPEKAAELKQGVEAVAQKKEAMKADGISNEERESLRSDLKASSEQIKATAQAGRAEKKAKRKALKGEKPVEQPTSAEAPKAE